MSPSLLFTIRTANRFPRRNYLGVTLNSLVGQGVPPDQIHVFLTDPDARWLPDGPPVTVHHPGRRLTPNENALAPIALLEEIPADWIILSEDDLEWCADPLGTMARWLEAYAQPDILVYRFSAFGRLTPRGAHVASASLKEQKGSQVIALRADDAKRLRAWATAHPTDWRPTGAPFQDQPHTGFDKLVGYWALQDQPSTTFGLVSQPFFVRHIGAESSLHARAITTGREFAGALWSFHQGAR